MKSLNVGRLELLQWINEFTECDYPKLELCCDGIGYCQVLDAIHPNIIPLHKLNFSAKYPDDYAKNLKLLDEAFNKLEIEKAVPIDKLSKGKFQDNMRFLQWLYGYASKAGPMNLKNYKGYERRMEALSKQKNKEVINPYLVPNKAFLKFKNKRVSQFEENSNFNTVQQPEETLPKTNPINLMNTYTINNVNNNANNINVNNSNSNNNPINEEYNSKLNKKILQLEEYLKDLESDLKGKMEFKSLKISFIFIYFSGIIGN